MLTVSNLSVTEHFGVLSGSIYVVDTFENSTETLLSCLDRCHTRKKRRRVMIVYYDP